jgi:hypothetical protein
MGETGVGRQEPRVEAVKEQMAVRQHIVPGIIEIYHLQLNEIVQGILAETCSREFLHAVINMGCSSHLI